MTMGAARDEFFRRYATSPIHVPRLERLLLAYGDDEEDESFARRFIAWDRACPDLEAARIVSEILSAGDESGRIIRLSDGAIRGAIRWMGELESPGVGERARSLRDGLVSTDTSAVAAFVDLLERSDTLDAAQFRSQADSLAR
jgi:hypothetical protein